MGKSEALTCSSGWPSVEIMMMMMMKHVLSVLGGPSLILLWVGELLGLVLLDSKVVMHLP